MGASSCSRRIYLHVVSQKKAEKRQRSQFKVFRIPTVVVVGSSELGKFPVASIDFSTFSDLSQKFPSPPPMLQILIPSLLRFFPPPRSSADYHQLPPGGRKLPTQVYA